MRTLVTLLALLFFQVPSFADVGQAKSCNLLPIQNISRLERISKYNYLELAEICDDFEDESSSSLLLYSFVKNEGTIFYREAYLLDYGKPAKLGNLFFRTKEQAQGRHWLNTKYVWLNSYADSDTLIKVYKNGILYLKKCLSNVECSNELWDSYSIFWKLLNKNYKEFRKSLYEENSEKILLEEIESFFYDPSSKVLSFTSTYDNNKYWHFEIGLLDSGKVNKLINVRKAHI